jgi:hypothetical protein
MENIEEISSINDSFGPIELADKLNNHSANDKSKLATGLWILLGSIVLVGGIYFLITNGKAKKSTNQEKQR